MKILFLAIALSFANFSNGSVVQENTLIAYSESWNYTTGYHSDGTSASIRYTTDKNGYIVDIEIQSQGYWYATYVKQDENGRNYVKNNFNKRYYF